MSRRIGHVLVGHIATAAGLPICGTTATVAPVQTLASWRRLYPALQCTDCREWLHA